MDKRTILFLVLVAALWFIYAQFVMPTFAPKKKPPATTTPTSSQPITPTGTAPVPITPTEPTLLPPPRQENIPLQPDIIISNSLISAVFTNKGAGLKSITLSGYRAPGQKEQLSLLNLFDPEKYSLTIRHPEEDVSTVNWQVISTTPQSVAFQYQNQNLLITKQFSITNNYLLNYLVTVKNTLDTPVNTTIRFNGFAGINAEETTHLDLKGVRAYREDSGKWVVREEIDINGLRNLEKEGKHRLFQKGDAPALAGQKDNVVWTGLVNKYFTSVMLPANPATENILWDYGFELLNDRIWLTQAIKERQAKGEQLTQMAQDELRLAARNNISTYCQSKPLTLQPGESTAYDFTVFVGPKSKKVLEPLSDKGLNNLLSFGIFGFISVILLVILGGFHAVFGNYGWSIIFLTVLVKFVLFPITKKGQVSMYKMQQMQPKIKALQEKYKNDKHKLDMEQMKLWKEHGVNPLSGCLPLLLQIPIFIGLYQALYLSIDLRQSPFMLWIHDLSQPDKLFRLPFSILGATDLHLLPLLMTVSWLVQSFTQPKAADPQARPQQLMMGLMPVVMLFFFYNVPSGLTLYWFVQTLLGIAEQQIIKKVYLHA